MDPLARCARIPVHRNVRQVGSYENVPRLYWCAAFAACAACQAIFLNWAKKLTRLYQQNPSIIQLDL